ncbi:MAG: CvpA family protein [Alistipes sp.]|nr:CvpA family protein [Alistipes sp.]
MNLFDVLTILVLVWTIFSGWRSGFLSQLLGLLGIIGGAILAVAYGAEVGQMLGFNEAYSVIAGFLITFVVTMIVVSILSRLLASVLSAIGLGWVNRILGAAFSALKGVLVLSMLYAAIFSLNEQLGFLGPTIFETSLSFDIVREAAAPLMEYWEEAKAAILPELKQALPNATPQAN